MKASDPDEEYALLLEWRMALRSFLKWSEDRAAAEGLTVMQHQLLVTIEGGSWPAGPSIGNVADALLLKPHSVVELVDRAVEAGFVERVRDGADLRVVHLRATPLGRDKLRRVTEGNREQLIRVSRALNRVVRKYTAAVAGR